MNNKSSQQQSHYNYGDNYHWQPSPSEYYYPTPNYNNYHHPHQNYYSLHQQQDRRTPSSSSSVQRASCHLHGKLRSIPNLIEVEHGKYECTPNDPCKLSTPSTTNNMNIEDINNMNNNNNQNNMNNNNQNNMNNIEDQSTTMNEC
jgi:hypothetical protein